MPNAYLPTSTYQRDNGNFPPFRLINVFAESTPTDDNQVALLSRPGLVLDSTNGSGPILKMFRKKGTYAGEAFVVSGLDIYRAGISIGSITGTGNPSIDASNTEVLITRGDSLYSYNGTDLVAVTFPDSADVRAVCFIGSLFVAVRGDGAFPGRFYWSSLLDGRTWDGLDYATAEREPDDLLDIAPLGDNIWLFGQQTVEAWANTGDSSLPFTRLENVAFDQGIHSTGAQCSADNSIFFVGSDCVVYRIADVPTRVSDHSIEERILASATAQLFTIKYQGHELVCIRLDDETLVYDCATRQWTEFQTNGGQWIASAAIEVNGTIYLGHGENGYIMRFEGWDDLDVALERRFPFAIPTDEPGSIDNVVFWMNVGQSDVLSGTGSDPVMEVRLSDDAGQTWSDWDDTALGNASLGGTGMYRTLPEIRALGMIDFPGLLGECRVTDPVPVRVSAVKYNTGRGGRQRG